MPLQRNLSSAVALALLQLPPSFDNRQLLNRICEISYLADIRMAFAEDSKKVHPHYVGHSTTCIPAICFPIIMPQRSIIRLDSAVW